MSPIAHDARQANAAAEKAVLRAFVRRVVRVTLLVLLCIAIFAGWMWLMDGPARAALEWLGGGVIALIALKLALGVLPAEVCVRIVQRKTALFADAMAVVRPYYWLLGFMMAKPHGIHLSDTWGLDLAAFGVFAVWAFALVRRKIALKRKHEESAK